MASISPSSRAAFASLRRFVGNRTAVERCELCSEAIPPAHRHLMEATTRRFICACDPCSLLFADHPGMRFRALPRRTRRLIDFRLTEADWEDLRIPINMAFFSKTGTDGRVVAQYPGPAGATESSLAPEAWSALEGANPILREMVPDVEALLVNRVGTSRDHFLVPIDLGFRLAGLIRIHWRGLSGGADVWEEIGQFFDRLRASSEGATRA
jgi:hypothetical protein